MEGPYQSPAFFPELFPSSTSLCIPKGAVGWSANHDTTRLCVDSMWLSWREPRLSFRPLFLGPSTKLHLLSALAAGRTSGRSMSSLTVRWLEDQVQPWSYRVNMNKDHKNVELLFYSIRFTRNLQPQQNNECIFPHHVLKADGLDRWYCGVLSPGGIKCRSRPRASNICPERRIQPQPLSVVREQLPSSGKPRLYVSHRRDAKERRKCPLSTDKNIQKQVRVWNS